ncbi:TadE/TadG family type IV pilus assembly protein [Microbacterium sp. P01]|uniref:TadE/TadG family type IV pilus assembly protein n=1 Tax=Microbacterium sp. P01 TaxID=3366261 RepID=UPI00366C4FD9
MRGVRSLADDESGSSPVEFVLVGALLTLLTLGVLQLSLAIYVRNVVHDAAVEGAFHAALADTALSEGADRTRAIVTRAVGATYADDVDVRQTDRGGRSEIAVTIRTTLPLIGLLGAPRLLEVTAHAPVETLD